MNSEIPEIIYDIILNLDYKTILSLGSTNKNFNLLCSNHHLWFKLLKRDFPIVLSYKPDNISYQQMYKNLISNPNMEYAAVYGDLYILVWLIERGQKPNHDLVMIASGCGHLHILKWLNQKGILKTIFGLEWAADWAADKGHLEILIWFKEQNILPTSFGADGAASNGNIKILLWLKDQGIFPTNYGLTRALENGHTNLIKILI
jgi:hypothetical protein